MILVVLSDREPTAAVRRFLSRTGFLLIPLSVLFIKYLPSLGRAYDRWTGKAFYMGVTTSKNTLGVICLSFGLSSLWRLLSACHDRRSKRRIQLLTVHGVILGMVLWLLWIANSMTSLSCFFMGSGALLAANCRAIIQRPKLMHTVVVGMLLVCISVLFLGLGPGVLETMGRSPTLTDRTEVWSVLLSLTTDPVFGTGFETFWLGPRLERMWQAYWWHPTEAHNGYIEVFLNLGWVGVALLAVVLTTGYRTVTAAAKLNQPRAGLILAFFVVGITYNFTEAAFFRMMAPAWIALLLAITRVPEGLSPKVKDQDRGWFDITTTSNYLHQEAKQNAAA